MKNKNELRLTDKQYITIFDFLTKTKLVDKVSTTEENGLETLSPDKCNKQLKIFFGKAFYELLTKEYPSPPIDDESGLLVFNITVSKFEKEIAELLLEAAPTEKEQIVLGKIIRQLIHSIWKIEESERMRQLIETTLKEGIKSSIGG